MVKETIPASRASGRGAEGMESREPHNCVLWRACHPAFENCNAFPLVYLFIYIISFFPALCQLLHPSTNERERGMSTPNSKGTLHTWRPVMQQQQQQETHIMALISICVPLPEGPEARMWALPAVHAAMDPDVSVRSRSRLGRACMQQSA